MAKEGGIEPLRPLFDHVAKAYLIGKSSDEFAKQLGTAVPYQACDTLDAAVQAAASDAAQSRAEEPVVLLAPACASYDQFRNFEERGERFRSLVAALPPDGDASVISRAERSTFANWWWTIDHWLLGAIGLLMVLGIVLDWRRARPSPSASACQPSTSSIIR